MQLKYSYHLYLVQDEIFQPCIHHVHKGADNKYYILLDVSKGPARLKQEMETLRKLHPERQYAVVHHYCNVIAEYIPPGGQVIASTAQLPPADTEPTDSAT